MHTRREFMNLSLGLGAATLLPDWLSAHPLSPQAGELSLSVFSKHLQFLDYTAMAETAAAIGFDGVDLTVRPGGHVEPEKAVDDLPRAVEAIHKAGLKAEMMASDVNQVRDEVNQRVLTTAAEQGIRFYRLQYFRFAPEQEIPLALAEMNAQLRELATFNAKLGLAGAYQNHAGNRVGAAIWDIWHLLEGLEPQFLGCQYDVRHAVVEGGLSWEQGLRLIRPKINSLVLKDFIWEKSNGKWGVKNVPLGEGMVDFKRYFQLLKSLQIDVPVSMHFEYELAGANHGAKNLSKTDQKMVIEAMKRDLKKARALWAEA